MFVRDRLRLPIVAIGIGLALWAAGALQPADDDLRVVAPGSTVRLERWNVELPASARTAPGTPYSEFAEPEDPVHVAMFVELELTGASTEPPPIALFSVELEVSGTEKRVRLDGRHESGGIWLDRDGQPLSSLQPHLPEKALLTWELPGRVDPADVRVVRLLLRDERFDDEGGPSDDDIWRRTAPRYGTQLEVRRPADDGAGA